MENSSYSFYAFISYSSKDVRLAKRVQRRLEAYRIPSALRRQDETLPKRLFPVFRDQTDLSGVELREALARQLDDSAYLIVVCTPNSARSPWVNDEIRHFRETGRGDKIVPVIVEGKPHAEDPAQECFCPELLRPDEEELLGVSVKELGWRKAILRLVATITQLRFDMLVKRDAVRRRRRAILASLVAVALILWGGLTVRMSRDPALSVELAGRAMTALEEENLDTAFELGTESVNNLFRKTDDDPGVAALKSAVITKAFCDADPFPHKVYSLRFDRSDDRRWIGNSKDGAAFVLFNGTDAFTYSVETGAQLGEYHVMRSEKDKAYITGLLGIDGDTDLYAYIDELRLACIPEWQPGEVNGSELTLSAGGQTYQFPLADEKRYTAAVNAEETVLAVYDGQETVTVQCMERDFTRTVTLANQFISHIYLSPKGNLMALFYRDQFDDQLKICLFDVSRATQIGELVGTETDDITTDLFLLDGFADYFYVYAPYCFTKYEYIDSAPRDDLGLIGQNVTGGLILSRDGEMAFLKTMYSYGATWQDRYFVFDAKTGAAGFWEYASFEKAVNAYKMFSVDPDMKTVAYILNNSFGVFAPRKAVADPQNAKDIYSEPDCNYQACAVSEDGARIVAAAADNAVYLYELTDGTVRKPDEPVPMEIPASESLLFIGIHGSLVCASTDRCLRLYDLETGELTTEALANTPPERSYVTSDFLKGSLIVLRPEGENRQLIYDVERRALAPLEREETFNVYCAETGLMVSRPLSDSYDGTVEHTVYAYRDGAFEALYTFNTSDFPQISFDPDGRYLIRTHNGEADGLSAVVMEADTGRELLRIPHHSVWIADGRIYDTSVPFVPAPVPVTALPDADEIARLAKENK